MTNINYFEILKRAWSITWHNRFLWGFGLMLVLGGGGMNWNFSLPNQREKLNVSKYEINNFFNEHLVWILLGATALLILILALMVLRIIAQAGVIKSVSHLEKNEPTSFSGGFREGKKYFWKMIFLGIILSLALLAILIAIFLPVIFLFIVKSYVLGVLMALVAVIIVIPMTVLFFFVKKYAYFYLVLSDLNIKSSLEQGYQLFRKNISGSLIMGLLFIPLGIVLAFLLISSLLIIAIPFAIIGVAFYAASLKAGLIVTIIGGILAIIFLMLLIQSIYQTFYQTTWYLFFQQIASIKTKEEVKEEVVILKKAPNPESA
jgi:hypothetical protein